VIGFLRGLLINHGTPPSSMVTQSNPIAPGCGQDTQQTSNDEGRKSSDPQILRIVPGRYRPRDAAISSSKQSKQSPWQPVSKSD